MTRDELVRLLDAFFGTLEVRGDEWADLFELVYPDPYWREYAEPGYEGRWNGLLVRGSDRVERAVTCVFPSDRIIAGLAPGTFLFSEHPIDYGDEPGFLPLSRESFELMRARGISFYNVHAPIDHHPDVSPSRLCAAAMGVPVEEEFLPIAEGIPGGAAVIGPAAGTVDDLAGRLQALLGPEVPVKVVRRRPGTEAAGRTAVVGGGGADREALEAALERGCETYVTGGTFTRWAAEFLVLAESSGIAVVDGTHYGTEKPPQLAMVDWFRKVGLDAEFVPDGPK
ncbi:MAG TPA: Nif3-like dinuclear metal center hexameric protein [Gaiellales bacterium]|nr:Nif3-like dinuclear metal center hexameric protein [Gaiellales bacterium]